MGAEDNGIITFASPLSFAETLRRIEASLAAHGANVFATIDHRAAAAGVGLDLPPATVIVFGNPRVGTPLMTENLLTAIDLPSKVLVSEGVPGKVTVSLNGAGWLVRRHGLSAAFITRMAPLEKLIRDAVTG